MSKMQWNKFTAKHPISTCFGAGVSKKLPKNHKPEKSGKILPTPFKLLCDWVNTIVVGDWTANSAKQEIKVADSADVAAVIRKCGAKQLPSPISPISDCSSSYLLAYRDQDYPKVAKMMGYNL